MSDRRTPLVESGVARASIVVDAAGGAVEAFAASELQRYLEKISGARLALGPDPSPGTTPIFVGSRAWVAARGVDLAPPTTGHDGYSISVTDADVALAGEGERGVLYAVYDILERLGCRWYFPDLDPDEEEVVPRREDVHLGHGNTSEAAAFVERGCIHGAWIYNLREKESLAVIDWLAKLRYNLLLFGVTDDPVATPAQALDEVDRAVAVVDEDAFKRPFARLLSSGIVDAMRRRGMILAAPGHCFANFLPNSLFAEHPEWFGMKDGERRRQAPLGVEFCWSNQEAVDALSANVVAFLEELPFIDCFTFAANDGGSVCQCEGCGASTPGDLFANVANTVLLAIRAAGLSTAIELTGGYPPVVDPPESVEMLPEIRIDWAHWGRHHEDSYGDPGYSMRENLDGWLALGHPFTMVHYYPDSFATPTVHPPLCAAMARDSQWLLDQGVMGSFMLAYPQEQWWSQCLDLWLGRTFYYGDADPWALLDEHCLTYYGAAGEPVRRYHRILAEDLRVVYYCCNGRWDDAAHADEAEALRIEARLDELERQLSEAVALAATPAEVRRVGKLKVQLDLMALMGRSRAANARLSLDVARAENGDVDAGPVLERLRLAQEHDLDVVEAAIRDVAARNDGILSIEMAEFKLLGRSAPAIAAAEERLRSSLDPAQPQPTGSG